MKKRDKEKPGATLSKGVERIESVNPNFKKTSKKSLSVKQYVEGIVRGDISILSQAITLVESRNIRDYEKAQGIIERCLPLSGNSIRVGITGVPGAGKSSFIEAVGGMIEARGNRLAVLAIDPSSERTKGSILGDKTRMESISSNPNIFIRPSPSAGSLGGVARKTRETIVLCEAAGYNVIFVETVGVGQSEIAVDSMVDIFLMLQIAGAGDELQGIKRGIMEMADIVVITKADGENKERAQIAKQQIINALRLFPMPTSKWRPRVMTCSSKEKINLEDVWQNVEEFIDFTEGNGFRIQNRRNQGLFWMYETINETLKENFYENSNIQKLIKAYEERVQDRRMSSFVAARKLLSRYFKSI